MGKTDYFETVAGVIPPSPDLFKILITDLSKAFDKVSIDSPDLNGVTVVHLFCADDLYTYIVLYTLYNSLSI